MDYEVSDIAVKVLSVEDGYTSFSIKATVENQSDDEDVIFKVQGVDAEGFEVHDLYLEGHIPAGTTKVLTKRDRVENSLYEQIIHWQRE